jgi:methionyl aminopeptidase
LHDDPASVQQMREAARVARTLLDYACTLAQPGVTTDEIDARVHDRCVQDYQTYPSPLNYAGFPKSICSSVNEIICHGIPDTRPLQLGDVVSFDVSCFHKGVHGDNCATIIVGDDDRNYGTSEQPPPQDDNNSPGVDWRGVPYRTHFADTPTHDHFLRARRLVSAAREALYAGIHACRPGGCLTAVGAAIHNVADHYGYGTVEKYRGHGICSEFHCPPFVKHFRNEERIELRPGLIFTIEPMLTEHSAECMEWEDGWTVSTVDGGLAAQFEHTVYISQHGVEILTVSGDEDGMVSI